MMNNYECFALARVSLTGVGGTLATVLLPLIVFFASTGCSPLADAQPGIASLTKQVASSELQQLRE
ncbi:MAG: hypothetical protein AAF664_16905, partial [Planctomycetota bacterium]